MSRFLITEQALLEYGTIFKPKLTEKLSAIGDKELSSLVTTLVEQYEKTIEYGEGLIKQSVLQAEERDTAVIQAIEAFSVADVKLASLMKEMKGVIVLFTFFTFSFGAELEITDMPSVRINDSMDAIGIKSIMSFFKLSVSLFLKWQFGLYFYL